MAELKRTYTRNFYTTYGNAAVNTAPDRRRQEREAREYREALLRKVHEAEKTERKAQQEYSLSHMIIFSAAILTVAVLLAVFMVQLSGNYRLSSQLEQKKAQYQELVRDNALLADKIDRQTDYAADVPGYLLWI